MKRLLLSLIFLLVAFTGLQAQTIWDGSSDTSWYNETSTEFKISTARQLAGLMELTNYYGTDFRGKTILLTADIVLNDTSDWENWENSAPNNTWTRIGSDYYSEFCGTFDGQGHTISGIYINSENNYQGLFGYNNGTIKNVGVKESYINSNSRVGGVCGLNSGSISNCYNSGTISGNSYIGGVCGDNTGNTISNCYNTGTVSGNTIIGGVCGGNVNGSYGPFSNCYNTGNVSGNTYVGGVCGKNNFIISDSYNLGTISGNDYIGGVCGDNDFEISKCYNSGNVTGFSNVGGVCGDNGGSISYCYNLGNVGKDNSSCEYIGGVCGYNEDGTISNCYNSGTVTGDYRIGGVCGYHDGINKDTISNCYNTGTVTGDSRVGGVCGYNDYKISNCYNTGEVSGIEYIGGLCGYNHYEISNCYNSGTVSGNGRVGGVCGDNYGGTISNCYYLESTVRGGIDGEDISGQAEVKTDEQFASGEVCWLLNGKQSEGAWGQKLGTDPYPVLGDPAVFKDGETYYNKDDSAIAETNSGQTSFVIVSENLTINIYGSEQEATVYNLAGNIVYNGPERNIPVQTAGMYIVRIGDEIQKTVVR